MRNFGKGLLVSQDIQDYTKTSDLNIVEKDGVLYRLRSNHENEQGFDICPM